MGTNNFLKKIAKYDGVKHLKTSLKKLAVPLADELVEKGIPTMVRMPDREVTDLTPKAKEFIENYLQGDIRNWGRYSLGRYGLDNSLNEEERYKYDKACNELTSIDKSKIIDYYIYFTSKKDRMDKEYRTLSRFHQTPKYLEESIKYFKHFPAPVYVIPVFQGFSEKGRAHFLDWQEALPILEKTGLDLGKVKSDLEEKNGIIFLSKSLRLVADFLPTTWMLFHAFFDSTFTAPGFRDFYIDIFRGYEAFLESIYDTDALGRSSFYKHFYIHDEKIVKEIANAITSKSGRPGGYLTRERTDNQNLLSEMLTQAIVKGKCTLNLESTDDPAAKERLEAIENWVNGLNIRERLVNKLSGKIVAVEVYI